VIPKPDWNPLRRNRAGGFIVREGQTGQLEVLLMRRYRVERGEYFVVPGGSVEEGEDVLQAAERELREETNVTFHLESLLYQSRNPRSGRIGHYFLARWLAGEPHLGDGPERDRSNPVNVYAPSWVLISQVKELPLFPSIIRERLEADIGPDLERVHQQPIELEESD
jgi:8-oxo-dGTP diphosphatase